MCGLAELPSSLLKTVAREFMPVITFCLIHLTLPLLYKFNGRMFYSLVYLRKGLNLTQQSRLLPIRLCCKAMEDTEHSRITKHVSVNNILLDSQHGLRGKLYTVRCALYTVHCHTINITLSLMGDNYSKSRSN